MKKREIGTILTGLVVFTGICSADVVASEPTHDTYVDQSTADTTYGTAGSIIADRDYNVRKGYMKFDAAGLGAGVTVTNLSLELYSQGWSTRQGSFYLLTGAGVDDWDESTLTWNNSWAYGNDTNSKTAFRNDGGITAVFIGRNAPVLESVEEFVWDSQGAEDAVISELNNGDRKATIVFHRNGDRWLQLASSDHPTLAHPKIIMETIPEPATLGLLGLSCIGLFAVRRMRM